jgi:glycosyltransferase involved in cell wall biosynthesis
LKPSLSVVVPLHNSQTSLVRLTEELLEVLPEMAGGLEVVLVDDGSTDATVEIAQELSINFPQVLLLVHPSRLGAEEALRSAMRYAHGDQMLLCREAGELDPHELPKLMAAATIDSAVTGQWQGPLGSIPRAPAMGGKPQPIELPDVLLVPRRLLVGWRQTGGRNDLMDYLKTRGYLKPTVALRPRRQRRAPAALVNLLERRYAEQAAARAMAIRHDAAVGESLGGATSRPRGSSRLMSRLRAFAMGE